MKCHHVGDEVSKQRVLIPGCWNVVNSNDIDFCTCYENHYSAGREEKKERDSLVQTIKELEKENKRLMQLLKHNAQ